MFVFLFLLFTASDTLVIITQLISARNVAYGNIIVCRYKKTEFTCPWAPNMRHLLMLIPSNKK